MRMSGGGRHSVQAVVKEVLMAWELCCTVDFSYSSHKQEQVTSEIIYSSVKLVSVCFLQHHDANLKYKFNFTDNFLV